MDFKVTRASINANSGIDYYAGSEKELVKIPGCTPKDIKGRWFNTINISTLEDIKKFDELMHESSEDWYNGLIINFEEQLITVYDYYIE